MTKQNFVAIFNFVWSNCKLNNAYVSSLAIIINEIRKRHWQIWYKNGRFVQLKMASPVFCLEYVFVYFF